MGSLSRGPSLDPLPLGTPCAPSSSQSTLGQERAAYHPPTPTFNATPPAAFTFCFGGRTHSSKGVAPPLPRSWADANWLSIGPICRSKKILHFVPTHDPHKVIFSIVTIRVLRSNVFRYPPPG